MVTVITTGKDARRKLVKWEWTIQATPDGAFKDLQTIDHGHTLTRWGAERRGRRFAALYRRLWNMGEN